MIHVYLASPYSDPSPIIRRRRFILACRAAAQLMVNGHIVFCPIAHGHTIDSMAWKIIGKQNDRFWLNQCLPFLYEAKELCVLKLSGWSRSLGVAREIAEATERGIKITYLISDKEYLDDDD